MKRIYISEAANKILKNYLLNKGYTLEPVDSASIVDPAIKNHPDIFFCRLGIGPDAPIVQAEPDDLSMGYPAEAAFNAACTGRFFIHNLQITNPRLLEAAHQERVELIHVPQGYAKCSIVIVDEHSIITYDAGIARACQRVSGLEVLMISPGHIQLDGYPTGFIGGCSGHLIDEIVFNGDLSAHPDFEKIQSFIETRDLKCVWFPQYPLTDIGSIV